MLNSQPEKTVAEFFAGIGLMRIGLERVGWRVVLVKVADKDTGLICRYHFGDPGDLVAGKDHCPKDGPLSKRVLVTIVCSRNQVHSSVARKGLIGEPPSAFWRFAKPE